MIVESVKAEGVRSTSHQNENPLGARDKPGPICSGKPTVNRWRVPRKPGSSWLNVVVPKLPLAREKNVSEYQDHFKAWPVIAVHRSKPTDCIRLKGDIDLLTDYANVYRGVKGEVAKLARQRVTVGTDACPFNTFTEYQDTYKAWSVLPARPHKPVEHMAQGDVEFVTDYAREYKVWKTQKRLPIIHLQQTAMPTGPFARTTSYRHDFNAFNACQARAGQWEARPSSLPSNGSTLAPSPPGRAGCRATPTRAGEDGQQARSASVKTHRASNWAFLSQLERAGRIIDGPRSLKRVRRSTQRIQGMDGALIKK